MGDFAVPTSQQHMTAGFMLVTMEDVVLASTFNFFCRRWIGVPRPHPVNVDEDYVFPGRALQQRPSAVLCSNLPQRRPC